LTEQKKRTKSSQNTRIYNECTINNICEPSSRGFYSKPRGTFGIESFQIRWFSGQSDGRLDLERGGQRHYKTKPSRVAIRLDLLRGGQRCSREMLEHNSRKPRVLVRKLAW
jgi:hypothetical protein